MRILLPIHSVNDDPQWRQEQQLLVVAGGAVVAVVEHRLAGIACTAGNGRARLDRTEDQSPVKRLE